MNLGDRKTIAIDANVISIAIRKPLSPTLQLLQSPDTTVVTTDTVVQEIRCGTESGELSLLKELSCIVLRTSAKTPVALPILDFLSDEGDVSLAEIGMDFVSDMYRKFAGTKSDVNLATSLADVVNVLLDEVASDASELVLTEKLNEVRTKAQLAAAETPSIWKSAGYLITPDELKSAKLGSVHLNNIRPPKVVAKVLDRINANERSEISQFFPPFSQTSPLATQQALAILTTLGLFKDNRISKGKNEESKKGSKSQLRDIEHIAFCAFRSAFLTSDVKCAKLAFSIYEAFSVPTQVFYVHPNDFDNSIPNVLNPMQWPN